MTEIPGVGGGIAGMAAALFLKKQGLASVIHEAVAGPLDRVCGEGILPVGVSILDELGLKGKVIEAGAIDLEAGKLIFLNLPFAELQETSGITFFIAFRAFPDRFSVVAVFYPIGLSSQINASHLRSPFSFSLHIQELLRQGQGVMGLNAFRSPIVQQ